MIAIEKLDFGRDNSHLVGFRPESYFPIGSSVRLEIERVT